MLKMFSYTALASTRSCISKNNLLFFDNFNPALDKKTMVVTTNSHYKRVIISGTIFYRWDRYNIVEFTINDIIIIIKYS